MRIAVCNLLGRVITLSLAARDLTGKGSLSLSLSNCRGICDVGSSVF